MKLFGILRRDGFIDGPTLKKAAERSKEICNERPDEIRWIRSYVFNESSGALGTVCIYEAVSADVVREHAKAAGLPVSEVLSVDETVVVRPDPE